MCSPPGPVVQLGVHVGLSSRRSRVQIPSGPQTDISVGGRVAQLVERAPEKREVTGSTPVSTTNMPDFRHCSFNFDISLIKMVHCSRVVPIQRTLNDLGFIGARMLVPRKSPSD